MDDMKRQMKAVYDQCSGGVGRLPEMVVVPGAWLMKTDPAWSKAKWIKPDGVYALTREGVSEIELSEA